MPFPRDASLRYDGDPNRALSEEPELFENFRKHTGLYVYSREYLLKFTKLPQTRLERFESLEQLRALENGAVINVVDAVGKSTGVDTAEDLDRVRLRIEFPGITFRKGTADDIPAISEAYVRSVRGSYGGFLSSDYLNDLSIEKRSAVFTTRRAENEDSYRLLIAEDEAAGVVGFIDYAHKETDNFDHDGRIFSFYFVPEFQRRGLGGLLFRSCMRHMRDSCYGSVCLDTYEANPFRGFYEKMGGSVIATDMHGRNGHNLPTVVYGWEDLSTV
jgi:ribosomal protein S18 acetylase RimI-like enzyme